MNKLYIYVFLSLCFIKFEAFCQQTNNNHLGPNWLKTAVIYQIYPQSFKDSDGDGIGDINGIIEKVEYLKALGVNAVWLNPIYPSPFQDAGYDVTDYYNIAPRYGNLSDFEKLVSELKRVKIKIILDLVPGHTSIEHPWFIESAKSTNNVFTDRYIWTNSLEVKPKDFVNGLKYNRKGNYLKNFFESQPALNYGYAKPDPLNSWEMPMDADGPKRNADELKKIIKFWFDLGVDGFRVDMANSLVKNDLDNNGTISFWKPFCQWIKTDYPECILIAEWGDPTQSSKAGFIADFLIHFGKSEYKTLFFNDIGVFRSTNCFFDKNGKGTVTKFVDNYLEHTRNIGNTSYISIPTSNHDFQRPACGSRNGKELKLTTIFYLTWSGLPIIYYGDEIGLRFIENLPNKEGSLLWEGANRAGTRTPMQWDNTINSGFSDVADKQKLYLPIDSDINRPTVIKQLNDSSSLLNLTRKLISLRKSSAAMGNCGEMIPLYAKENTYPFIYQRKSNNESFVICLNPSGNSVSAKFNLNGFKTLIPITTDGIKVSKTGNDFWVEMTGISYGVYRLQK